jgi:hypothetical protein
MAKHWLAVMYYFGYGVEKDEQRALQILKDNDIFNSQALLAHLPTQNNDWIPISAEELTACSKPLGYYSAKAFKLNKTFTGKLIEFDWYGTGVKRLIPITITFNVENKSGDKPFTYDFTINGATISGTGIIRRSRNFYFNDLQFSLPRFYKDHPDKNNVTYKINLLQAEESTVDGIESLLFHTDKYKGAELVEFGELMKAPIRMIVHEGTSSQSIAASTSLRSLQTTNTPLRLRKDFAVVTPNPIGNRFTITYTLDQAAEVKVGVYDFYGQQKISVPSQKNTTGGVQTITIDSAALPSGTYVIQMTINGMPYSKTVVKL